MMQTKQNKIWKNECVLIEILETYKEHFRARMEHKADTYLSKTNNIFDFARKVELRDDELLSLKSVNVNE